MPLLQLVDPPSAVTLPTGGHWVHAVAGLLIAQMRWQLFKAGKSTIARQAEAAILEECHNYGSKRAIEAARGTGAEGDPRGDFQAFCGDMVGKALGQGRYGNADGITLVRGGLVQTAWAERYGFDAPHPACPAFTHFLKQWLFNYGPLYATLDGTALQSYTSGVLTNPASDGSEEPVERNAGVLVVGYCDRTVDESQGGVVYQTGHWICRMDLGQGTACGEGGFVRVAYGALGINDAMQFVVVRLSERR